MPKKEALQAMNEIEIHGQLSESPYIVKYIDSFISGANKVNIVMEYCSGGDLQSMLRNRR
jgi:serine/threonine protein kinase